MEFYVKKTGSAGNSYYLSDIAGNTLMIEAGVKPDVSRIGNCEGLLISHTHGDHYAYIEWFLNFANQISIEDFKTKETENFEITALPMLHYKDASYEDHINCQSFLIFSKIERKMIFFATDFFYKRQADYYEKHFKILQTKKIDLIAIECNYNDMLINIVDMPDSYKKSSKNHMSDHQTADFVSKFVNPNKITKIITLHGSNRLSIDREVKDVISKKLPNSIVIVAKNETKYKF